MPGFIHNQRKKQFRQSPTFFSPPEMAEKKMIKQIIGKKK
jgi:hypothetical protein